VKPGHRLIVGMMAGALAVMFVGLGARGASANPAEPCLTLPGGTTGQTQAGTVKPATGGEATLVIVDENGQLVPVNDGQFCVINANDAGNPNGGFAEQAAPAASTTGTTCTIPLPEGAVPGTVL